MALLLSEALRCPPHFVAAPTGPFYRPKIFRHFFNVSFVILRLLLFLLSVTLGQLQVLFVFPAAVVYLPFHALLSLFVCGPVRSPLLSLQVLADRDHVAFRPFLSSLCSFKFPGSSSSLCSPSLFSLSCFRLLLLSPASMLLLTVSYFAPSPSSMLYMPDVASFDFLHSSTCSAQAVTMYLCCCLLCSLHS